MRLRLLLIAGISRRIYKLKTTYGGLYFQRSRKKKPSSISWAARALLFVPFPQNLCLGTWKQFERSLFGALELKRWFPQKPVIVFPSPFGDSDTRLRSILPSIIDCGFPISCSLPLRFYQEFLNVSNFFLLQIFLVECTLICWNPKVNYLNCFFPWIWLWFEEYSPFPSLSVENISQTIVKKFEKVCSYQIFGGDADFKNFPSTSPEIFLKRSFSSPILCYTCETSSLSEASLKCCTRR